MSEKKKIKINIDTEDTTEKPETEEPVTDKAQTPANAQTNSEVAAVQDPIGELESKLKSKEEEAKETYDRLLRLSAEFENYKKRSAREMEDFRKFANQSLLKEMLSVVDNLELAMNSANEKPPSDTSLIEGLDLTHKEILRVFEKFCVHPIEAKQKPFDPTYHEAVMREDTDEYPENTVTTELQKGYLIHDRLLRPAMVVVAKPKTKKADSETKKKDAKK